MSHTATPPVPSAAAQDRPVGDGLVALVVDDNQIDLRLIQRTVRGALYLERLADTIGKYSQRL